ncbi:hypothetical protein [Metabacillus mangrovi]|nr:hypothetical protein [Metabacillus mangrovi]
MALVIICRTCSGSGKQKRISFLPFSSKCSGCNGTGKQNASVFKP